MTHCASTNYNGIPCQNHTVTFGSNYCHEHQPEKVLARLRKSVALAGKRLAEAEMRLCAYREDLQP